MIFLSAENKLIRKMSFWEKEKISKRMKLENLKKTFKMKTWRVIKISMVTKNLTKSKETNLMGILKANKSKENSQTKTYKKDDHLKNKWALNKTMKKTNQT